VAKLQRENRAMEDRLAQEEIDNGELTARLDDARNLLRDRGLDLEDRVRSRRGELRESSPDGSGVRTLPAGQPARRRRKPPFAQIPGQVDVPSDRELGPDPGPRAAPDAAAEAEQSSLRLNADLDHHSFYNGPLRWMPIAGGSTDRTSQVR
jgi:hypothetical protein